MKGHSQIFASFTIVTRLSPRNCRISLPSPPISVSEPLLKHCRAALMYIAKASIYFYPDRLTNILVDLKSLYLSTSELSDPLKALRSILDVEYHTPISS